LNKKAFHPILGRISKVDIELKAIRKTEVDMTEGSTIRLLIGFAIPLLLGNLFQQLYNTVDTWVVGNFVGKTAFSAVGTLAPVINMLIGLSVGFSNGASVVISQAFGAHDLEKVRKSTHTFVAVMLIMCVVLTVVGLALTPLMLKLIGSPEEVAKEQTIYLTIYFAGVTSLLVYNTGSSILRAVGNSRYPLICLVVCAVANIILDLVFVIVFHWGTAGVAWATVISQAISGILVVIVLLRTDSSVKLDVHAIRIDRPLLKRIFTIGLPSALQMSITAFSNVFVQSYIYQFGVDCMGGWTAYSKVDQLLFLPMQSLALAATTFVGQNLGRGYKRRALKGTQAAMNMSLISTALLIIPIELFATDIVTFFIDSSELGVLEYGTLFLMWLTPFYLLCCANQVYGGALRGAGNSKAPMIVMLGSFVVFRQIYLFVMSRWISNTILPIAMSYPAGWLVCSLAIYIMYRKTFKGFSEAKD
jgi:putative MATE family efflux protein